MFDTLFLDLDGVVLNFKFAEAAAAGRVLDAFGCPSDAATVALYSDINDGLWKAHERGEIDKAALKVERFRRLTRALGVSADAEQMAAAYVDALSCQGQMLEGVPSALKTLKGRYKMYAVTNGIARVQRGRIAAAGIARFFNGLFISEELGYVKPQREFFEACLAKAGVARARVLVVGDSLTADIAGANAAGLRCCWITDDAVVPEGYSVDYTFDSLKAFAEAVEESL